jgi:hypothetical protein
MNLHRSKPLIIAVVPLDEIAVHLGNTAKAGQFACHYRTFEVTDSGLPFPLSQIEEIQQARPHFTAVDLIEHFVPSSRRGLRCSAAPCPRQ